jgi:AcrR family transcriptional regulator
VPDEQTERAPLRREVIVETARELIRVGGLNALSLRRLAGQLGVTAPALYAHVSDKRDLLRAVAEVEFDRLMDRFAAVRTSDPVERLRAYNRAYVDHARESPELFEVMFLFPPDVGTAVLPEGAELPAATKAFTMALAAVEESVAAGLLEDRDPLVIALTLWTAAHGAATARQLSLLPPELDEQLVDEVIDRLLRGWTPGQRSRSS